MLRDPVLPTVQIWPSRLGAKSNPKIEPSWVFIESIYGVDSGVKMDILSY
jgi:hypothetical protein